MKARLLALLPFVLAIAAYLIASHLRLAENPQDKILPSLGQMGEAVQRMAFAPDPQSGEYVLWRDTWASLKRMGIGVGVAGNVAFYRGFPQTTRISSIVASATGTSKGQVLVSAKMNVSSFENRFDIGFGKDSKGVYFGIQGAF